MSLIDMKNLDRLSPEQRDQFNSLLAQFPHLNSKMDTSRELNTPTKIENLASSSSVEEIDYSSFSPLEDLAPPKKIQSPELRVNSSAPSLLFPVEKDEDEKDIKTQREEIKQKAVKRGIAPEVASFRPEGKVHPILQKFRLSVGLKTEQQAPTLNLGGCTYAMRSLDREKVVGATTLALVSTQDRLKYETNLETALVAHSVISVDGVPLHVMFSIPETEGNDEVEISEAERETRAIKEFYYALQHSPNELVEALSIFYAQEFPPLELMGKDKAKFLCPVEDCTYSRISEPEREWYCTLHGEKMVREDRLPNPS